MMKFKEETDREVDLNTKPDLHVNCSVCLELVDGNEPRSTAKLQCGHEFHLECIGSAFNAKGIMQCPNCRNIEKGQWLYAIGSANVASDMSMDSWMAEQYPFFLVPYGFRVCPVRGLMEMEDPSIGGDAVYGSQVDTSLYSRPPPNEVHLTYPPWRHHLAPPPPTAPRMIDFGRRSSSGFPATYLPAGRAFDPPFYPPPPLPHYLQQQQPGWARGVHFAGLPSEPWLTHR